MVPKDLIRQPRSINFILKFKRKMNSDIANKESKTALYFLCTWTQKGNVQRKLSAFGA